MELETKPYLEWKKLTPSAGTISKTPSEKYIITNGVGPSGSSGQDPRPAPVPREYKGPKDYGDWRGPEGDV